MADEDDGVEVTVIAMSGTEVAKLRLDRRYATKKLKQHLQEQFGYPLDAQQLLCEGTILRNDVPLESLPLPRLLTLVLRPFNAQEALFQAAPRGHAPAVRALLTQVVAATHDGRLGLGTLLRLPDKDGDTLLHLAAMEGHAAVVQLLLTLDVPKEEVQAMLASRNVHGRTVLHAAAYNGSESTVQVLWDFMDSLQRSAVLGAQDVDGDTPLHDAVNAVNTSHNLPVQVMLTPSLPSPDFHSIVPLRNNAGQTVLHVAAHNGNEGAACTILERLDAPARNSLLRLQDAAGDTAVHVAAKYGHAALQSLLAAGIAGGELDAILAIKNLSGQTALQIATCKHNDSAYKHNGGAVRALLELMSVEERHAMLRTQDGNGDTLLHQSAKSGHEIVTEVLLASGSSADDLAALLAIRNASGRTALNEAMHHGQERAILTLWDLMHAAERSALLNVPDDDGETPLHCAAKNGHEEPSLPRCLQLNVKATLRAFLQGESDVKLELENSSGQTALHLAAYEGHERAVCTLLDHIQAEEQRNGLLMAQDHYGDTPLHDAIGGGHLEVIQVLLVALRDSQGSWVAVENKFGRTALHIAAGRGDNVTVLELLELSRLHEEAHMVRLQDKEGDTPLHDAARGGHQLVVQTLLACYRANKEELGPALAVENQSSRTAMQVAATDVVRQLLVAAPF